MSSVFKLLCTVLPIVATFITTLNFASPVPGRGSIELAQTAVMGNLCQTQFGVCPLLDPNGQALWLPVGSACFCASDPGQVRQ